MSSPVRIGVVVHPSRAIEHPLRTLREWTEAASVDLVQVPAPCYQQQVAEQGDPGECDLIVSIGGDGTTLAAIRAGAGADRPVLGVACGSLGVLTTVVADDLGPALERFSEGDWNPHPLPALDIARDQGEPLFALNDISIVRSGEGQVRVRAQIDGITYARFAGDGCIVSTPVGSSAYAFAAGGPLLMHQAPAFLLTPLSVHGGCCPPLVIGAGSQLELETTAGHGGARVELDGQVEDRHTGLLKISLREAAATVVAFSGQEPFISRLRERRVIIDSPRILADEDRRPGADPGEGRPGRGPSGE
ncbi:MAG: NAD(+)/NADH kinase [Solirubrobacterales bacterium]|nr:NAD(+)/NADH kinase [Solirubrobacterales bacterium]